MQDLPVEVRTDDGGAEVGAGDEQRSPSRRRGRKSAKRVTPVPDSRTEKPSPRASDRRRAHNEDSEVRALQGNRQKEGAAEWGLTMEVGPMNGRFLRLY